MREKIKNEEKYLPVIPLVLFFVVLLRHAWISDDAYITFRTIDNLLNGYGLTWNVSERVQTFTHPLWMFILTIPYAMFGHIYFTTLIVSIVFSVGAVSVFAFRISRSVMIAVVGIVILTLSDAFIDYTTSGLENPLSFLLLALFYYFFLNKKLSQRTFFLMTFIAGLALFNRMDTILLFLPALAYSFWRIRSWRALYLMIAAFAPFLLWELFSLFYYGFLFPNTAYAKLNLGFGAFYLIRQGFSYLMNCLSVDPLTFFVMTFAFVLSVIRRDKKSIFIMLGVMLMILYIIRVGGCFMAGRHFAAPLFVSVIAMAYVLQPMSKRFLGIYFLIVLLLGLVSPGSPVYYRGTGINNPPEIHFENGILDERMYYHSTNGLINYSSDSKQWPTHDWVNMGLAARNSDKRLHVFGVIGMIGYFAGPDVHILDFHALADPLLAHLPAQKHVWHRVGHFSRIIPPGYEATLKNGVNQIEDEGLYEYYEKLSLIISGDLLDWNRLAEIVNFNLGEYEYLTQSYAAQKSLTVCISDINDPQKTGTDWDDPGNLILDESGVEIDLEQTYFAPGIEISHDHNDDYYIEFLSDDIIIGKAVSSVLAEGHHGLITDTVATPKAAIEKGYDKLHVYPSDGDLLYSVGHVRIIK